MASHLLNFAVPSKVENKLQTLRPTPFYDPGTVPVRMISSVPFEHRNDPIRVRVDDPPKVRKQILGEGGCHKVSSEQGGPIRKSKGKGKRK